MGCARTSTINGYPQIHITISFGLATLVTTILPMAQQDVPVSLCRCRAPDAIPSGVSLDRIVDIFAGFFFSLVVAAIAMFIFRCLPPTRTRTLRLDSSESFTCGGDFNVFGGYHLSPSMSSFRLSPDNPITVDIEPDGSNRVKFVLTPPTPAKRQEV